MKNFCKKMAMVISENIGGMDNIIHAELCSTRIRFDLKDITLADMDVLKEEGCLGTLRYGRNGLQVIVGLQAESVFEELVNVIDGGSAV